MNRKAVMIISTVAVFVLTVIAAFLWLFRVRYIDVDVNRPEGDETSMLSAYFPIILMLRW